MYTWSHNEVNFETQPAVSLCVYDITHISSVGLPLRSARVSHYSFKFVTWKKRKEKSSVVLYDVGLMWIIHAWNHFSCSVSRELDYYKQCILSSIPTRCNVIQYSLLLQMLYMFRSAFSPIIRSSKTVHIASGICPACLLLQLAWVSWKLTNASGSSKQAGHMPGAVCTVFELLMIGGKAARNM